MKARAALWFGVEDYFQAMTGYRPSSDFRAIEAVDGKGERGGMVLFDQWTPAAAQTHFILSEPIALRCLAEAAADFIFRETKRNVLMATISTHNKKSLDIARRLGFRDVGIVKGGWSEVHDVVHLELRREHCRHLNRKDVKS